MLSKLTLVVCSHLVAAVFFTNAFSRRSFTFTLSGYRQGKSRRYSCGWQFTPSAQTSSPFQKRQVHLHSFLCLLSPRRPCFSTSLCSQNSCPKEPRPSYIRSNHFFLASTDGFKDVFFHRIRYRFSTLLPQSPQLSEEQLVRGRHTLGDSETLSPIASARNDCEVCWIPE